MSELTTKWPERIEYYPNTKSDGGMAVEAPYGLYDVIVYERARAEAALERLRLAVEALKSIDGFFPEVDDKGTVLIRNTLSAIGPLPDLPPVQKEG